MKLLESLGGTCYIACHQVVDASEIVVLYKFVIVNHEYSVRAFSYTEDIKFLKVILF